MATQLNILQLNGGVPIDDPTNSTFYVVIGGVDYPIEFDTLFRYLYRSDLFTSTGLTGQIVTYSTPFLNVKPLIFDPSGSGFELISWNETGFVIDTYGVAEFGYLTIKDR